jgi:hypothetical protein
MLSVGRHRQPWRVVLGLESMNHALVAAIAAEYRDDVTTGSFLADHRDMSAVG